MPPNERPGSAPAAIRIYRYDAGAVGPRSLREIAVETPVEIRIGGAPFAVMMATPRDLEDFAVGFAFTEGIVQRFDEIREIDVDVGDDNARVDVTIAASRMQGLLARKRSLAGRTGCGLCGVEDLSQMPPRRERLRANRAPPSPHAIGTAVRSLDAAQPLNAATRAVHGAAWCRRDGAIHAVREDVGRHNALDKLIGACLREGVDPDDGFLLITSRCSFEMVAKAEAFGARVLVAISAPTSLALQRAAAAGLVLIGVARADGALAFGEPGVGEDKGAAA